MSEKRRLGKGLGALIPEVLAGSGETGEFELKKIQPNPFQPRKEFDQEKLQELARSIKEHGVLQAVVITPADEEGNYYLVAGERRCRAAQLAGLHKVPAVIKSYDQKTMLEIALIENLQREDLNPVEEALAYQRLLKEFGYTQEELAQRLGKSRPAVANSIRLLALPEEVLNALKKGLLSAGQARPLLTLAAHEQQIEAAQRIIDEGLTAREAERFTAELGSRKKIRDNHREDKPVDPEITELQTQIQRSLGTKVKIKQGVEGGIIEIYYYGGDDLDRLIDKLLPEGL